MRGATIFEFFGAATRCNTLASLFIAMSSTIIAQGLSAIPLNDLDAVSGAQFKYSNIFGNQRLDSLFHTIELIPIDNLHDESLGVSNISYRFRGQSLDESRKFQFTCTFTIGNEETQNSRLSSLDIILETPLSVTEPSSSLKAFVSQCCESLDLVSALHGIDSFAKLYLKRSAIIQRLSQLYGKDTLLTNCPHGDFYAFPTTVKGPGKQTKGYYLLSDEWKFLLKWEIGIKPFQHNSSADAHSIIKALSSHYTLSHIHIPDQVTQ